ncbi:MAG: hypothetical protein ACRD1T_02580, partial [Acidimicrobiia bacterium]
MRSPDLLETAVRVWTEIPDCGPPRGMTAPQERPRYALLLDTETTVDASQRLNFGSYRYCRISWDGHVPHLTCVEEGLFHADDLERRDPEGYRELVQYTRQRAAEVRQGFRNKLWLRSELEFRDVLWEEAIRKRSLIVGFNLPFDLSRFAFDWGEARGSFAGGFSLPLWLRKDESEENKYRPRLAVKSIDSKRALKGFQSWREPDWIDQIAVEGTDPNPTYTHHGHLLDLRTLVYALTDRSHSLKSACEAFGVRHGKLTVERHGLITPDYIDYNRADVRATAELAEKALAEYYRHPIELQPTRAYSPASIGKAYLHAFGITPILQRQQDFTVELLGYAMEAYYGGRAECRIRKTVVPVVYVDFLSMYPTINALMGLWRFHIAERIETEDATDHVRELLERTSAEDWFDQALWPDLPTLVQLQPDGDILPVRARYEEGRQSWQIGVNPLWSDPRWYTLADAVDSKVLTGRAPRVLRAIAFRPEGTLAVLRPLRLRGEILIDPITEDPFRRVIEERVRLAGREDVTESEREWLRLFLKVFANGTSYGILAEINRQDEMESWAQVYAGDGSFPSKVTAPEKAGVFSFPPISAFIAGGARLMLALLEHEISVRGGTHAICDTDSMAIVASEAGGSVPCPGGSAQTEDGGDA